jgi:hypothetical protein
MKKLMSILIGLSLVLGSIVAMSAQTGKSSHSVELMKKKKKKGGKKGGGPY